MQPASTSSSGAQASAKSTNLGRNEVTLAYGNDGHGPKPESQQNELSQAKPPHATAPPSQWRQPNRSRNTVESRILLCARSLAPSPITRRAGRIVCGDRYQHPDPPHPLRARRERPVKCRTATKRDEIPPYHETIVSDELGQDALTIAALRLRVPVPRKLTDSLRAPKDVSRGELGWGP